MKLADFKPPPMDASPSVSIIVPARNEARNLERCLRSLLAADYPRFEIIVVNDRSTDATGEIARRFAKKDHRVVAIDGAEKPEDWAGKPWACWQGYQKATSDIFLFTDADTEHGPRLLARAVGLLRAEKADLVTVMPLQEMKTFWERTVQPFFFLMLGLRFGGPGRLNRNTNPRHAIANGQFILVTRDSYEWIGGHKKVCDSIIEDLELAVAYTEGGRVLRFANAEQDMKTRMYQSFGDLVEGWGKNTFIGILHTMRSKPLAYLGMLGATFMPLGFLLPPAALIIGALLRIPILLIAGGVGYLLAATLMGLILRAAHENPLWGLFYPFGAFAQLYIFLKTTLRGTRKIEWKGRTYSIK